MAHSSVYPERISQAPFSDGILYSCVCIPKVLQEGSWKPLGQPNQSWYKVELISTGFIIIRYQNGKISNEIKLCLDAQYQLQSPINQMSNVVLQNQQTIYGISFRRNEEAIKFCDALDDLQSLQRNHANYSTDYGPGFQENILNSSIHYSVSPKPPTNIHPSNQLVQNFVLTDDNVTNASVRIRKKDQNNEKIQPPSDEEISCDILAEAIEKGNVAKAQEIAEKLASLESKLTIQTLLHGGRIERHQDFNIFVQVADKYEEESMPPFPLSVDPSTTTVRMLKYKVFESYGFPVSVQRWIISDKLRHDTDTLTSSDVKNSGTTVYLYLISQDDAKGSFVMRDKETQTKYSPHLYSEVDYEQRQQGFPFEQKPHHSPLAQQPTFQHTVSPIPHFQNIPDIRLRPEPVKEGWNCPVCTFRNLPTYPGCQVCCSGNRPADYIMPVNYKLEPEEERRLEQEQLLDSLTLEAEQSRKNADRDAAHKRYYETLNILQLKRILPNNEPFDCPICFTNFGIGEAVMLRECLHNFCKDCLAETIKQSEDPEVHCPFNDDFSCPAVITGQEIEELLTEEDFHQFLERSLAKAENATPNSFHCQTANCKGWCVYEDDSNIYDCPICNQRNCLTCKAIHPNLTCKQYQDDLKIRAENDDAAKKTQEMLKKLVDRGDAMHCPSCKIILQKKSGCDWMRCTMCRTEICWATKGPRWGPMGAGDTSGGCRCKVNGRCTPNCGNCH